MVMKKTINSTTIPDCKGTFLRILRAKISWKPKIWIVQRNLEGW